MDASALKSKTDDSSRKFIYTTAFLAALLPEYIAPLLTLAGFVVFKRRYSLTAKGAPRHRRQGLSRVYVLQPFKLAVVAHAALFRRNFAFVDGNASRLVYGV